MDSLSRRSVHNWKGAVVPKASKQTASQVEEMGVLESRSEELGGYTVEFTTFREDADATPFFKSLPDDRCQSPHWGYVLAGEVTFSYADREGDLRGGRRLLRAAGPHPPGQGRHRDRRVQPDRGVPADAGGAGEELRSPPGRLSPMHGSIW